MIAIVGLTLLGFLTANFVGRSLVPFGAAMLDRTPLVRGVCKGVKQVFKTIFSQSGSQFRKVGLVEFPVKGRGRSSSYRRSQARSLPARCLEKNR